MERVVDPAIADLQAEPPSVSRYLAVIKAIALCVPEASLKFGFASLLGVIALALVAGIFELRPVAYAWSQHAFDPWMLVYLLPQGLVIAVNVALAVGIVAISGGRVISRRAAAGIIGLSLVVSAVSFINVGWVTPPANQAFREGLFRQTPTSAPFARGFNELTFFEVREQYALATRNTAAVDSTDLHFLAVSYHGRWALTFAPLVFAVFALLLANLPRFARWTAALGACAAYVAYLLYMDVPNLPALDGRWLGGAAWYPELALVAIITLLMLRHRQTHAIAG
jgi:hypothetical protein